MTTIRDSRDVELSTHSPRLAAKYDQAVDLLAGYFLDPLATIEGALAEDQDFISGHCLRAAIGVLGAERAAEPLIREGVAAGRRLAARANERERRHFAAAEAWLDGDFHRAVDLYGRIVLDYPHDLLALQVAHVGDFYLGQQRLLKDRVTHALPHFDRSTPGFNYVLGMLAFGLEENNLFELAETTGLRALELEPRDPWAVHAVAHVFEMTGKTQAGIDWLTSRAKDWSEGNGFAFHNFWHLSLFHMERGDVTEVLRIFDEHLWPKPSAVALEMVDASALLFRSYLRGIDVGERARSVAEAWSDPVYRGYYAFNDVHAVMAFVAGGRREDARATIAELERRAGDDGTNAIMSREVGLPLARSLVAFAEERYDEVVETLLPVRLVAHKFGGSNAQRDVIDQTLVESAIRGRKPALARALIAERRLLRPESPWAHALERRVHRNEGLGGSLP